MEFPISGLAQGGPLRLFMKRSYDDGRGEKMTMTLALTKTKMKSRTQWQVYGGELSVSFFEKGLYIRYKAREGADRPQSHEPAWEEGTALLIGTNRHYGRTLATWCSCSASDDHPYLAEPSKRTRRNKDVRGFWSRGWWKRSGGRPFASESLKATCAPFRPLSSFHSHTHPIPTHMFVGKA